MSIKRIQICELFRNPKTLPLIAAGPLNFATSHWANGIIFKAFKSGLTEDDLFDTPWKDSSKHNAERYELRKDEATIILLVVDTLLYICYKYAYIYICYQG